MKALLGLYLLFAPHFGERDDVVPGILIVQSSSKTEIVAAAKTIITTENARIPASQRPKFDEGKFETELIEFALEDVASQEFDEDGKLTPVAWSLTDPIFRAAVEERLISHPSESPSLEEMKSSMSKLKVGYVFVVSAFSHEGEVWTQARLLKGNKEIWADKVQRWQNQMQSPFDEDNNKRSIVRTWVQVLTNSALKDLPKKKRAATPEATPGAGLQNSIPVPEAPQENKQILIDAMKLLSTKQNAEAVNLLRDAVDADPSDSERRQALISALMQTGEPELAAREARRAAHLMPEKVEFWISAARGWLACGKSTEALEDLNEAIARDAEGPGTRLLLGEVQLAERRFSLAAEHFEKVLEKSPTAYVLRLRAFTSAIMGEQDDMQADLDTAAKAETAESDEEALRRARLTLRASVGRVDEWASENRLLIQRVRIEAGSAEVKADHAMLETKLKALRAYFSQHPAPAAHGKSSVRLLLALNLLAQSLSDLRGSLEKLDEDALTEATINLGEALKAMQAAKTELLAEVG